MKWLLFMLLVMTNEIDSKIRDSETETSTEKLQTGNDDTQQPPPPQPEPQPIPSSNTLSCSDIKDGSSFSNFEKCPLEEDTPFIGNLMSFVRLDFSAATGDQITKLFAQPSKKNITLSAAIRLVNNKKIAKINFGKLGKLTAVDAGDEIIIEIASNPNLEEIKLDFLNTITLDKNSPVFIYNNPQLAWPSNVATLIKEKMTAESYFETEKLTCTFQNPLKKTDPITPDPDLLSKCKIFRGDLKLNGGALTGEITFNDGCLHLDGVDMEKVTKITAEAGKGHQDCKLIGVKPKIENNRGLCGDNMKSVAEYVPKVVVKLHDTCTIICKDKATVNNKFYRCEKIDIDVISLENWFKEGYEEIAEKLTEAKGISITGRHDITKIDFPILKTVTSLEISDNGLLKELNLPKLENAGKLTITKNLQLTLDEIKKLPKTMKKSPDSVVECNLEENIVVTDIDDLRHCTIINGKLIIRNVKKDVNPADFNIKEVAECITIENTELSNLGFLENAEIPCTVEHILKDNKNLCLPEFLRAKGAKVHPIGGKKTGCKKCISLSETNCGIFEGDLTVDDRTLAADLAALEVINGKLTITGSATSLEFPALTTIINSKAPALVISNNPKLTTIKMPKIKTIEAGGQPAVKIENSPDLKDLKEFLPAKIADTCSRSASASCQYDKVGETEESWIKDNIALLAGIAAGVVILGAAAGVGFFFYKRYKRSATFLKPCKKVKKIKRRRKWDRLSIFAMATILYLGQLGLVIAVIYNEMRDLNDQPVFLAILISISGLIILLILSSAVLDSLLFLVNRKRHKHKVRPVNLIGIKTGLQSMKTFLLVVNLMAILSWSEYDGILSLDIEKTPTETLKRLQNLEVTAVKSITITLLELILFAFAETCLLSFGPRIVKRTRRKKNGKKKCSDIKDGSSFSNFEKCALEEDTPFIGNTKRFVRLDFSAATGDQIAKLFAQPSNISITLSAAIRLVNNKKIAKINFGKVGKLTAVNAGDEIIIEIASNPNLEEIKLDFLNTITLDKNSPVFIYNNPQLTWPSNVATLIKEKMTAESYFETEKLTCTFQNPLKKTEPITPDPELLSKCKIFRGDLKLNGGALTGEITFNDGCLHLDGVDMEKVTKITAEAGKGHQDCKLTGVKPKIENNRGLCGDNMKSVAEYLPPSPKVVVKLHDTCTIICKDKATVNNKFYRCEKIDIDVISLENWFKEGYEEIAEKLTEAKGISITGRHDITKIDFPVLKTVTSLEISDNGLLKELNLPKLENAGKLTITKNLQLTLDEIKKLPKTMKKAPDSVVECNLDENTVVTDIEDLRHCTIINGKLIIRNVKKDVNPADFNIKEVTECITIENTELSNLGFLENAKISCTTEHTLKDNKNLCLPEFLLTTGAKVHPIGGKTEGCGKTCTSLSEKNCVVFDGDLTVDDKTLAADLAILVVINGKLTITGSATSLEFPALTTIINSKAPALVISNNPKLTTIKMPKIKTIEAGGQPAVKIENSPDLKDLKQFLPAKIAETCSRSASTSCQYDKAGETEESWIKDNTALLAGIAAGVVILGAAAGGGFFFYKRYKKKKKTKAKAKAKTPTKSSDDEESGGTIVDRSPTFEVLDAIQTRNPKTNNQAYLYSIADSVVKLIHGTIQYRILLRTTLTEADIKADKIDVNDLSFWYRIHDESSKMLSDRLGLNHHVYLVNEQYQLNLPEFTNALLAPAKKKVDKKKKPAKKSEQEKKTKKERTKAGKGGKKDDGKKKGKKTEKSTKKTAKSTKKTDKSTIKSSSDSGNESKSEMPAAEEHQKIKLIHIGPGFKKSMKFLKGLKISPLTEANGTPYRKISDIFPSLRSTLVLMEYTDGNKTHKREVELTEMIVPELVVGQLHNLIQCPWISLLYYAWQNNIVVHTSVPDYLVCSFYFYSAIDLLNYRIKKEMDTMDVELYGMTTMYPCYHKLFAGPNQKDFDEINAYSIYVTCMIEWLREYIPGENGIAQELKRVVHQLLVTDQMIHMRWKQKKTDTIQWDLYVRDNPDPDKHTFTSEPLARHYYNRNEDTTPYYLPPPAEKLKYTPILEYDDNLDCLTRDVDAVSVVQKPAISCDVKTVVEAATVDSIDEAMAAADGEKKKKKTDEKKGNKKNKKTDQGDSE